MENPSPQPAEVQPQIQPKPAEKNRKKKNAKDKNAEDEEKPVFKKNESGLFTHKTLHGFLLGKQLKQELASAEPNKEVVEKLQSTYKLWDTSMSQHVEKLFIIPKEAPFPIEPKILTEEDLLDLSFLTKEKMIDHNLDIPLTQEIQKNPELVDLVKCSEYLRLVAKHLHSHVKWPSMTLDQINSKYQPYFSVLVDPKMFTQFFQLYLQKEYYLCFLTAITYFERMLGDFIHAKTGGKIDIPTKMSDLITHAAIVELFGPNVVFLFRAWVGPLCTLNVRNVMLHGFVSTEEFQDAYTTLLLSLMLTLGKLNLENKWIEKPRPQLDMNELVKGFEVSQPLHFLLEPWTEGQIEKVVEFLRVSNFVIPKTEQIWKQVIQSFIAKQYYHSLILLFPTFEHSLRRIFVCSNKCSDALVTAESDNLYTTLDIILAEKFEEDQNAIFNELSQNALNAIFDIVVWKDPGLRTRDLVSHGSVDPSTIPASLTERILAIALGLAVEFHPWNTHPSFIDSLVPQLSKSHQFLIHYSPVFHPCAFLMRETAIVKKKWREFGKYIQDTPNPMENNGTEGENKEEEVVVASPSVENSGKFSAEPNALLEHTNELFSQISQLVAKKLGFEPFFACQNDVISLPCPIPVTLKFGSKIGTLRNTTKLCLDLLDTVLEYHKQLYDLVVTRKAWARHRKAFKVLNLPLVHSIVGLFMMIVEEQARDELMSNDNVAIQVFNVAGSLLSCASTGTIARFHAIYASFASPKELTSSDLPLLSKKEVKVFWMNVQSYIDKFNKQV